MGNIMKRDVAISKKGKSESDGVCIKARIVAFCLILFCTITGPQIVAQQVLVNKMSRVSGTAGSEIHLRGAFTDVTLDQINVTFKSLYQQTLTEAEVVSVQGEVKISVLVPEELDAGPYEIHYGIKGSEEVFTAAETFTVLEGGGTFGAVDTAGTLVAKDLNIPYDIMIGDTRRDGLAEIFIMSDRGEKLSYIRSQTLGFGGGLYTPREIPLSNGYVHGELADLDNDGDLDLVFTSRSDDIRWLESRMMTFGDFRDEAVLADFTDARMIKTGDINGDGHLDLVVSSLNGEIHWYRNIDGTAEFDEPNVVLALEDENRIYDLIVDDFDFDGDLDIVSKISTGFAGNDEVHFHENDGSGNFAENVRMARGAYDINNADIDGDGQVEALVALSGHTPIEKKISAFSYNEESGSFDEQVLKTRLQTYNTQFTPADIDSDGDLDIVMTEYSYGRVVWMINTDGKGTFSDLFALDIRFEEPENVLASDFDLDGDLDVISVSSELGELKWYENYDVPEIKLTNVYPKTLKGGDKLYLQGIGFNGYNSDNQITLTHIQTGEEVSHFPERVFSSEDTYRLKFALPEEMESGYYSVRVTNKFYGSSDELSGVINVIGGDFEVNNPEKPEYVFFDSGIQEVFVLEIADMNADMRKDVVMLADNGLYVSYQPGSMNPSSAPELVYEFSSPFLPQVEQIIAHDSNGDGDQDLLVSRNYGDSVGIYWFESKDGSFSEEPEIYSVDAEFYINHILIADVDNDGYLDLVASTVNRSTYRSKIYWFRNIPDGGFGESDVLLDKFNSSILWPISVMIDIDDDGDDDLFTTVSGFKKLEFYENTIGESFTDFSLKDEFETSEIIRDIKLFDINGDNNPELLYLTRVNDTQDEQWKFIKLGVENYSETDQMLLGDNVLLQLPYGRSGDIGALEAADIDADGDDDLLLTNIRNVKLFRNNYEDTYSIFQPDMFIDEEILFCTEVYGTSKVSAIADMDGDGDQDLVVAQNFASGATLGWFQNQGIVTGIGDENGPKVQPVDFALGQNYPNPFNPSTQVNFNLADAAQVKLSVYNALGQKVADLVNEYRDAGSYTVSFDASDLSSGVYFYRIETAEFSQTKKMLLIK